MGGWRLSFLLISRSVRVRLFNTRPNACPTPVQQASWTLPRRSRCPVRCRASAIPTPSSASTTWPASAASRAISARSARSRSRSRCSLRVSQGRIYLQIVESHRTGDQVRQRVIATLGRLDELEASGKLDRLLRSGARFVQQAMVLDAMRTGEVPAITVRRIGPALLFERLWVETGCQSVITALARRRGHRFRLERAVFLSVLHRLMRGGSDLAADRWREEYRIAGSEDLDLHHLYRAMAWLGEELPADQQDGATRFAPRCSKDLIEEHLFAHRRDLFSRLDLVFMDVRPRTIK